MGKRACLIAGAVLATAIAVNPNAERFPLSGLFTTGLEARISVSRWNAAGNAIFDFMQPDGAIAFRWQLNANKTISRSHSIQGTFSAAQSWGGFPLSDTPGEITFAFLRTDSANGKKIEVSMGKPDAMTKFPWFDFALPTEATVITHVAVWDGFVDPQVVVTRPECKVMCEASECTSDPNQLGPVSVTRAGVCSAEARTGGDILRCCTGSPVHLEFDSVRVGQWVQVTNDALTLSRATAAFPGTNAALPKGSFAKVVSTDPKTHQIGFWVASMDTATERSTAQLPPEVLFAKRSVQWKLVNISKENIAKVTFQEITRVNLATGGVSGVPAGWFATIISEPADRQPLSAPGNQWVYWMQDRYNFWQFQTGSYNVGVLMTDIQPRFPVCTDFTVNGNPWKDAKGNTCEVYQSKQWCTFAGKPTPNFKPESGMADFNAAAKDGFYPPRACCYCAGGGLGGSPASLPSGYIDLLANYPVPAASATEGSFAF